MDIKRHVETTLLQKLKPNKVLALLGARRVGKTQLLKTITDKLKEPFIFLNGDDIQTHNLLEIQSTSNYSRLLGTTRLLIIDEAQEIPQIGKKLKLMVDTIENLKIIITGSSAFEIHHQVGEPLVGRMHTIHLYPLAQLEFSTQETYIQTQAALEERLIFGGYPELTHLNSIQEKSEYLRSLVNTYLLKDILAFEGIKKQDKIVALLQKLAYRTGSEVSLESLGRELQISKNTVEKYLDLFQKVFIMESLSGFSRNLDNEITKMKKWYFLDNGIRNALINNFNPLHMREDAGPLWENYLNAERIKKNQYLQRNVDSYFWRTHARQEIDRIETYADSIEAFEYKWGKDKAKLPVTFKNAYPDATFITVNRENYLEYIS